jgi:DNA primase
MSQRIEITVFESPEVVLGMDGDTAGERVIWRHIERQHPRPREFRPVPDWELEAQREHWGRMACQAEGTDEMLIICRQAIRDLDDELERRRNLPYQRVPSPYVWPAVFEAIKSRADLLSVICARRPDVAMGRDIRSGGRITHLRCPFHIEKSASLAIYRDDQHYHCFGCKASGDVLDAVQKLDGLSFMDTVHALATEFGIELPRNRR